MAEKEQAQLQCAVFLKQLAKKEIAMEKAMAKNNLDIAKPYESEVFWVMAAFIFCHENFVCQLCQLKKNNS